MHVCFHPALGLVWHSFSCVDTCPVSLWLPNSKQWPVKVNVILCIIIMMPGWYPIEDDLPRLSSLAGLILVNWGKKIIFLFLLFRICTVYTVQLYCTIVLYSCTVQSYCTVVLYSHTAELYCTVILYTVHCTVVPNSKEWPVKVKILLLLLLFQINKSDYDTILVMVHKLICTVN